MGHFKRLGLKTFRGGEESLGWNLSAKGVVDIASLEGKQKTQVKHIIIEGWPLY